jgi:uncharacterized protein YkwD
VSCPLLRQHAEEEKWFADEGSPWLVATAIGILATLFPTPVAADVCIPALPSVAGVTQSCAQGSQSQPQQAAQAGASSQSAGTTTKPFSVAATPDLARALAAEVTRTRRAHGLRPLRISTRLADAGTAHARALAEAGQFTHAWPTTGSLFASWIRSYYPSRGYRSWSAGENLLWASPTMTPANAVQQWLDSPAHRRVMLSHSWRELGIGVVTAAAAPGAYGGRDVQIAAAEFGTRRS